MFTLATTALMLANLAGSNLAYPVDGKYWDIDTCDNHGNLQAWDELGDSILFPDDELIETFSGETFFPVCPGTDDPDMADAWVYMINLTGRELKGLFYVGDPETRFSNIDGFAASSVVSDVRTLAFRIDNIGANQPLIYESIAADNVFQPGEVWIFIIQDYQNSLGLAPSFGSLDFSGASAGDVRSSGSIVLFRNPDGTIFDTN